MRRGAAALATAAAMLAGLAAPATAGVVAADPDVVRQIVFPIAGPVSFSDTFGACRSDCARQHEGTDVMAAKLTPLVAARDARVSAIRRDATPDGSSGNYIFLTDDEGWSYWYIHTNNDTPGTDDGANPIEWQFAPGLDRGSRVEAGQLISWVGDSGNAENTGSHVHFEIHNPDGEVVNPYRSLVAASRIAAPIDDESAQAETSFVQALYTDFLGRAPGDVERTVAAASLVAGRSKGAVIDAFAGSDEWVWALVDTYYQGTLGRTGDDGGRAYWADVIRAGRPPAAVAADFYASDEYHARVGGTDADWLRDLQAQLRGVDATDADLVPFLAQLGGGTARSVIAFDLYQSWENRAQRVEALYQSLLGRSADEAGLAYWSDVLADGEDLLLARYLAGSEEYTARAVARFSGDTTPPADPTDTMDPSDGGGWTWTSGGDGGGRHQHG